MKKIILLSIIIISTLSAEENKILFFGNCIACHGEFGKRVAPHMIEVKGYYLIKYPKKEEFVKNMATWLSQPNPKNAQLPQAIQKYKLMPYLAIDLDTLKKIATYIYEYDDFGGLK
jgi:cytochrome c551/c552